MSDTVLFPSTRIPKVRLSPSARHQLERLVRQRGRQVLVIHAECAAPSTVHVEPESGFHPSPDRHVLAVISGYPVWADESALRRCPHQSLVLVPTRLCGASVHLIARADDSSGARRPS